jgi:hypothetical protein
MTPNDRLTDMLERYGEVCTRVAAAKILGCSTGKIKSMLHDGRLETACGGTMVDVRSISEYIVQPRQSDEAARQRRMGRKWSV